MKEVRVMARRRTTRVSNALIVEDPIHIPLDQARILETALQLLNEMGLRELSMRKIADKLQVKTASLYYHVKDREQLMQLLLDRICREMVWPEAGLPWQDQIYQWAGQFRKVLLSHRGAVELFSQTIASGYERLTQIEKLYQLLVSAGFADLQVPWIASMLKNYVLGFVAEEDQLQSIAKDQDVSYEEMGEQVDQFFRQLPEEQFPNMIRLATYTTKTNWENEFHFGLSVLIDGFSVKLMPGN
ncbi:TetR/AcrR family transcriptional regulator C-terminal domain-containing protein [Cohnella soli]|uniref:TetR/AcrR family transcriptional regulator C-terminal domain-containing protein n=1 Tax=Cohnella soli TaxID=425005 RepID=A0ABW0I3M1_9BACL